MPPPVLVGWRFPAGVPQFWTAQPQAAQPVVEATLGDYIWVIAYDTPLPPLNAARLYYYSAAANDVGAAPAQAETNPHFVARFTPAKLTVWRQTSWDQSQPPPAETQPH